MSNLQNEFLVSKKLINNMYMVLNSIERSNNHFNSVSIKKLGQNVFNNITTYNNEVFEIYQMNIQLLNNGSQGRKSNNTMSIIQIDLYKDGKIICNIYESDPNTSETELKIPFKKVIENAESTILYQQLLDRIDFNIEYHNTNVINSLEIYGKVKDFKEDWSIGNYSIDISDFLKDCNSLYFWASDGILNSFDCDIYYGEQGLYSGSISVNILKDNSIADVEITTNDIELTISDINNKYFIDFIEEITESNFIAEILGSAGGSNELSLKAYINFDEVPKKIYEILQLLSLMDHLKVVESIY
ncbi:hypothetical protein B5723_14955 [Mammaliicoccus sciuri]|uniref:hypothetical protein n=1 Tax=Mammaliicoccus sciuri TaxID=1296 RepID=UPI0009FE66D9|nr:hypothetical protein [Mammaliicoccus sciuri]ORI00172.1 hypothetical protein B5723_14955 [Mammaliicoccus sciuri]